MRAVLLVAVLVSNLVIAQPQDVTKSLMDHDIDSSSISIYKVVTREMMSSEGQETEELLNRIIITNQDATALLKKASKKSSYQDDQALLTHHNLVIHLYQSGTAYGTITLSSITGNITVSNSADNHEAFGNVSKKLGQYIILLLKKYDQLTLIQPMGLEGLTKEIN